MIGVLKRNSEFYDLSSIAVPHALDNSYIIPIKNDFSPDDMDFSDYDMGIAHLVVFFENDQQLKKASDSFNRMNLFRTDFLNASEEMKQINSMTRNLLYRFTVFVYAIIALGYAIVALILKDYVTNLILAGIGVGIVILVYPFAKIKKLKIIDILRL